MSDAEEGVIVYLRSEPGDRECVCCDGPHVFCRYIKLDGPKPVWSPGTEHVSEDFPTEWLGRHSGSEYVGRRVRITIELLDEPLG